MESRLHHHCRCRRAEPPPTLWAGLPPPGQVLAPLSGLAQQSHVMVSQSRDRSAWPLR